MDFLRYLAQVMDVHPSLLLPITMAKRDRITRLGRAIDHVNVNKDNNVKNKDNYARQTDFGIAVSYFKFFYHVLAILRSWGKCWDPLWGLDLTSTACWLGFLNLFCGPKQRLYLCVLRLYEYIIPSHYDIKKWDCNMLSGKLYNFRSYHFAVGTVYNSFLN